MGNQRGLPVFLTIFFFRFKRDAHAEKHAIGQADHRGANKLPVRVKTFNKQLKNLLIFIKWFGKNIMRDFGKN